MEAEDQYVLSDTEIEMMILDTPLPLMKDLVREQISSMNNVNYMEIIVDKIDYMKKMYGDDPEVNSKIQFLTMDIANFFIEEISSHFNLNASFDRNPEDMMDIAKAMYNALILGYKKNVRKYLRYHITRNRKEIAERYNNKKKDVTTTNVKKKVKNRELVAIISNLPLVVRDLVAETPVVEDYFESFKDYDNELVLDAFNNLELSGSLDTYFGMLLGEYEYMLYDITDDLKDKLIK